MLKMPQIPAIPGTVDRAIRKPLDAMRLALNAIMSGKATQQQMLDLGILKQNANGTITPAATGTTYTPPTYAIPNPIIGLVASGAFATIVLSWTNPAQTGYSHAEVWRSTTDNVGTASLVGSTSAPLFTDTPPDSAASVVYYYWIRGVNKNGDVGPYNATPGTSGSTSTDPTYAMNILLGKLGFAQFSAGNFPVRTVATLPALPDAAYPVGAVVVSTTDGVLYRNNADTWTAAVASTAVTGQLTNAQIADISAAKLTGTITGTQIQNGSISTPKLAAGAVTANNIAANTITASQIAAAAITAGELAAASVVAGKIAAGAIVANDGVISNASIGTAHIIDATMTTAKIANLAVDTTKISDAAITSAKIGSAAITSAKIGNAQVNDAHITSLSAGKILAGIIAVAIELTSPVIRFGQTAFNTGSGFWIGSVGGIGKISFGNASRKLTYDGTNITIDGDLIRTVSSGLIPFASLPSFAIPAGAAGYYEKAAEFTAATISGVVRVSVDVNAVAASRYWAFYKNGVVAAGPWTGVVAATYTANISIVQGDRVQLYIYAPPAWAHASYKNFNISCDRRLADKMVGVL